MEPTIERLRQKILLNSIDNIDKFDDKLTFKEKKLSTLHKDTIETTKQFKDITEFNFDSIDKSKKQIAELKNRYDKCFRGKSTTFLSLIFKDKAMLFLCYIFLLICIFTFLTK